MNLSRRQFCRRSLTSIGAAAALPGQTLARALSAGPERTVVRARKVVSAVGPSLNDHSVVLEGERISAVLPSAAVGDSAEARLIEADTVLPGLIECHAHLMLNSSTDFVSYFKGGTRESFSSVAARNARTLLECGVTTARDLGAPDDIVIDLKRKIRRGATSGPQLLVAGVPMTVPGGSAYQFGGAVDSLRGALDFCDRQFQAGADLLKVMVTGGVTTGSKDPDQLQMPEPWLRQIMTHAQSAGKRIAAHCHGAAGIRVSALAGANTIEHASFLTPAGSVVEADIVALLAGRDVAVVPTLQGIFNSRDRLRPGWFESRLSAVSEMIDAGVCFATGSDAGAPTVPFTGLPAEIQYLAMQGLSAPEAIVAATMNAARALGVDARVGSIEKGKRADLLIVRGDPEENLAALRDVVTVLQAGRIVHDSERHPDVA